MSLHNIQNLLVSLLLVSLITGCVIETKVVAETCRDVDCDGHGTCFAEDDGVRCHCDPGYQDKGAFSCVEDPRGEECLNIDCNIGGTCFVKDGRPKCNGGPGYAPFGDITCQPKSNVCVDIECGLNEECWDFEGDPRCRCAPGFRYQDTVCVPL